MLLIKNARVYKNKKQRSLLLCFLFTIHKKIPKIACTGKILDILLYVCFSWY